MAPQVSGAEPNHVTVNPPAGTAREEQGLTGVAPETGLSWSCSSLWIFSLSDQIQFLLLPGNFVRTSLLTFDLPSRSVGSVCRPPGPLLPLISSQLTVTCSRVLFWSHSVCQSHTHPALLTYRRWVSLRARFSLFHHSSYAITRQASQTEAEKHLHLLDVGRTARVCSQNPVKERRSLVHPESSNIFTSRE